MPCIYQLRAPRPAPCAWTVPRQDDSRGVSEPLNETETSQPYNTIAQAAAAESLTSEGRRQVDGGGLVSPFTDGNGVGLGLGRTGGSHFGRGLIVRARYVLSLEAPTAAAAVWRPQMDAVYAPPQLFFGGEHEGLPAAAAVALGRPAASYLRAPLPPNVQIVTLRLLDSGEALLRLAHQFGIGEDAHLSKPVSVDLATLFTRAALPITSAVEMTLTANQPKSELRKRRAAMAATARAARGGGGADAGPPTWLDAWPTEADAQGEARTVHPWRSGPPFEWDT